MYETELATERNTTETPEESGMASEQTEDTPGTPEVPVDAAASAEPEMQLSASITEDQPDEPETPDEGSNPQPETSTELLAEPLAEPPWVPLARFKGVQHQLNQAEKERDAYKALANGLEQELAAAHQRAAAEYAERIKTTYRDIVPELIRGETIEQVDQTLAVSRAAFTAARQAYARTIPTLANGVPNGSGAGNSLARTASAQQTGSPSTGSGQSAVEMISRGLRQPPNDINL